MELVAPIFNYHENDIWTSHLGGIFFTLDERFETFSTRECSTHIHISPLNGPWTLEQVKRVAKAAVYFERATDSIMPPARLHNLWCQTNRRNVILGQLSLADIFARIDSRGDIRSVARLMCTMYSPTGEKSAERFFRWNFTNLESVDKTTIEFRQPPASRTEEDAHTWIMFTNSFVQAAMVYSLDASTSPSLELLKQFVSGPARAAHLDTSLIDSLFVGRSLLPPLQFNLKNITTHDWDLMVKKAKAKDMTLTKFKKLYGYK